MVTTHGYYISIGCRKIEFAGVIINVRTAVALKTARP